MEIDFVLFACVGFLAQLVDGALGMAYGVVSTSVLLSFGIPPATASASVHSAELFTTAASSGSHIYNRNVDWRLFRQLAPAGIIGGIVGAYVLTSFDGAVLKPFIAAYLGITGTYILFRAFSNRPNIPHDKAPLVAGLGLTGGFIDAAGGGGWGPVVTTGLVGSGHPPRQAIGTVNTAEFFLTFAVSATFIFALLSGHWRDNSSIVDHLWAIGGLITGGVVAAPLAGMVVKLVAPRQLQIAIGCLIAGLGVYQSWLLLA